jgi:ABC-type nitrate/sulfonate/bicarbonate transport system permease component
LSANTAAPESRLRSRASGGPHRPGRSVISRNRITRYTVYAVSLFLGALAWEVVGQRADPLFLAPLSATLNRLVELTISGELLIALLSSLQVFGLGLAAGIIVGLPAGLALARVRLLRIGLEDYVTAAYATPIVALIPFILAIFGFGSTSKVLVVFLFAVFPMIISVFEGASSVDPRLVEVARSFRARERDLWRDVIVPYTLPFAMTGFRLAIARSLVGMIAAEFLLSVSGLGELILVTARRYDTPGVFAVILVVAMLGVVLMAVGQHLENRFSTWRGTS